MNYCFWPNTILWQFVFTACMQAGSSTFRGHLKTLLWVALKRAANGEQNGLISRLNWVLNKGFYYPPSTALESLKIRAELGIEDNSEDEESSLRALEKGSLWFSVVRHPFEHFASAYGQMLTGLKMRGQRGWSGKTWCLSKIWMLGRWKVDAA